MNPRTKAVDTKATTAAEFLTGATPAPTLQPQDAADAASTPVPETEAREELPKTVPLAPHLPQTAVAVPSPVAVKVAAPQSPNPFVELWKHPAGTGSVRAMQVPGGCVVSQTVGWPGGASTGLCFVPGAKIEEGKLIAL